MALLSGGPQSALGMGAPTAGAAVGGSGRKGFIGTDDPRFSDPYGSALAMGRKKKPTAGVPAPVSAKPGRVTRDLSGGRKKSIYAKPTMTPGPGPI
jgi:hypothetical protein